jgi:hypothetical protein
LMKNGRIHLAGHFDQSQYPTSTVNINIQEGVSYEILDA